jgi:hypothetical protein
VIKRKITNIISVILILTLLPATSGVALFHHICHASSTHHVSLFKEYKCDHHEETTGICEHCLKHINCCSLDAQNNCIKYIDYLSIDVDFVVSSKMLLQVSGFDMTFSKSFISHKQVYKEQIIASQYFKKDIKKPIISNISNIILQSQNKSSDKPMDNFIS